MSTLYPGVLEQLNLGSSPHTVIAIGTLRLDTVIRPSLYITAEEPEEPVASTSSLLPSWQVYTPGLLQDLADIRLATRKKLSQAAKGAQSTSRGTPTSPRTTLKRKRSTSSTSNAPDTPSSSAQEDHHERVLPPTLHEIDHLVKNAFIAVEYAFIEASTAVKQEDNEDKVNQNEDNSRIASCLFRIYAVPLDAPGLNSRIDALQLKIRSKATKALAQKTFTKLLYHLHYDAEEWKTGSVSSDAPKYLLTRNPNALSILEVYNKLEDPKPQALEGVSVEAQNILDDILREDAPEGMSSRLYDFQKTCLWKLASRELAPQRSIDLSFSEHSSIDNNAPYYVDANSMIWNTAQYYVEPKAAIVSEGMGTGKTCICLALILVFKHQLVNVDEARGDSFGRISSRRTARSEAFPWVRNDESEMDSQTTSTTSRTAAPTARDRDMEIMVDASRTLKKVPSLYDLTLDLVLCSTHFRSLKLHERADSSFTPTNEDLPYVWEIPRPKQRDDTRSSNLSKRKVYISSSTLIIVPDILIAQWLAEIQKHIHENALDYIKIEKDDEMPNEMELSKLDLVLVSESKIRMEESRFWSATAQVCRCPYIGNTREIACKCKKVVDYGISPLVGVWWKRLIVDEGHKVAGSGELVQLCMRLRTESRYVVSGTPSKNLVGLHDVGTVEQSEHQTESSVEGGDKNDFERLAKICNFIGMQPFSSESSALFMKTFYDPFKMRGDTSRIEAFFARTMVRHRVPDVAMPPLTRRTVVLEFNELERITYNVLLALFISNSVLSERQDEDYFFHPKNKAHLGSLLSNLGAAHLLFSSSELLKSAQSSYTNNIKAIALHERREPHQRWCEDDLNLIHQAQWCFMVAFDSILWKASQKGSMLYSLQRREINPELLKVYDGLDVQGVPDAIFTGEKLTSLRYQIGKLARDEEWELRSGEELEEELITIAMKEKQRMIEESQVNRDRTKPAKGAKPTSSTVKKKPVRRLGNKDKVSATKAATGAFEKNGANAKDIFTYQHLPLTSHLDQVFIPSVASTKVAYVVKSILEHPNEKFLVFAGGSSSSAHVASNNLFYLAEGLDLANVPFLIFARTLSQEKLAAYAKAFSESTVFRVLLLDLKFAGRGLTLSKATRIIFTEPVWHKDEEAQAVKRAHRLGQDKPVHVETLVMKDSFEEKVMLRGAQLSRRETAGAKTPYQDTQLSAALRVLTFLPDRPDEMDSYFSPLQPPLRLIPSFLHDAERQDLDIELARFRQQAQDDLAAQLETHSRGGSASRSRSTTPAVKREGDVSTAAADAHEASNKAKKSHGKPLQAEIGYKSGRPRLPSALKHVTNARPIESDILMSARISEDDGSTSEEDVVVVTSRRVGVHFV